MLRRTLSRASVTCSPGWILITDLAQGRAAAATVQHSWGWQRGQARDSSSGSKPWAGEGAASNNTDGGKNDEGGSGSVAMPHTQRQEQHQQQRQWVFEVEQRVGSRRYTWSVDAHGGIQWSHGRRGGGAAGGNGSSGSGNGLSGVLGAVRSLWGQACEQLQRTFLPAGYPFTVGPGYLEYVSWQAVHHMASAANGVLASTSLLYSIGLGSATSAQQGGAVAAAGAINWALKDGLGQAGSLLFGRAIAHRFDLMPKGWYLGASLMLDAAIGLEISTQLAPQHFLALGSLANAVKGLAWMAGGSTRSAFNVSFQRNSNIADITAKATSQTITTSLVGTTAGIALAGLVGRSVPATLAVYAMLSSVHLYSGYRSVKCIPLATLNPTRLQLLTSYYWEQVMIQQQQQQCDGHRVQDGGAGQQEQQQQCDSQRVQGGGAGQQQQEEEEGQRRRQHYRQVGGGESSQHPLQGQQPDTHGISNRLGGSSSGTGIGSCGKTSSSSDSRSDSSSRSGYVSNVSGGGSESSMLHVGDLLPRIQLPTPEQLREHDPALHLPRLVRDGRFEPIITVGRPLHRLASALPPGALAAALHMYQDARYLLLPSYIPATTLNPGGGAVAIVLHQEAGPADILEAYLQACLLQQRLRQETGLQDGDGGRGQEEAQGRGRPRAGVGMVPSPPPPLQLQHGLPLHLLRSTAASARQHARGFRRALEDSGWFTGRIVVEATANRAVWGPWEARERD